MQYSYLATAALFGAVTNAADHLITVGPDFKFHPASVNAARGDTVSFRIGEDHNVQSGSFDNPCETSGFSSGESYHGGDFDPQLFRVTINNTEPIYGYCGEEGHCQAGMVFAINPPSSGQQTLKAYQDAARKTSDSSPRDSTVGGTFVRAGPSGGSSSSSSSRSSSSSSPSSSSSGSAASTSGSTSTTGSSSGSATSAAASSSSSGGAAPGAPQAQQGFATAAVMMLAGMMSWFL